jgi:prepilin-type N-terminal cleavage/methylation domain-containing protein
MRHFLNQGGSTAPSTPAARTRRGFTLIEAAMVTVIIGIGVVGMLQLLAVGTLSNSKGTELTTAINLANNIREISLGMQFADPTPGESTTWNTKEATVLDYDDIKDLDGCQFSPPLDVNRKPITGYEKWKQRIVVQTVDQNNVKSLPLPPNPTEPTARVTVTIEHSGSDVYVMSWLAVAPKAN